MNPLDEYPVARKIVYSIFWVWGLVLTVWQVAVASIADMVQPRLLTIMLAVFPAAGGYVGYVAMRNTPRPDEKQVEDGE